MMAGQSVTRHNDTKDRLAIGQVGATGQPRLAEGWLRLEGLVKLGLKS